MSYTDKLQTWFDDAKRDDGVVDIKFFPGVDQDGSIDKLTRAVFETVTGVRARTPIDCEKL